MAAKKQTAIDLSKIRNIGVIAHIDAGKTTTTEHLLYYAGAKHQLGAVDKGNTETDYDPEEQQRGITIYSACIPFAWRDCRVNLIDTPGHVDFTAEVQRSLRVLDGCVVVFDAQKGVEAQSETVWRQANEYEVPRIVFINKMDVVGANFARAVADVAKRLHVLVGPDKRAEPANPVPLIIPIGAGSVKDSDQPFGGVIDLLERKALYFDAGDNGRTIRAEDIPEAQQLEAESWREKLFDALTAHDEKDLITSTMLDGKEVPLEAARALIRELTLARKIQPVLCGSGREHIGIQPLLDAVTYYLPSPLDRPPVEGKNPKKKDREGEFLEEIRKPEPGEPFCGLVFKYIADSHGGLYYVRIYSGTLKANSRVYNPGRDRKENVGKLYHTHADPKDRQELPEAYAGDIVAVIGPQDSVTGDTFCETQHPVVLERIDFKPTVVSRSVEPESSADKQKLVDVLSLMTKEDPTFTWSVDKETGQTLMNGMGMLHLEIKKHRMERDFRLKARVGKPRVSYRETLAKGLTVTGEAVRQAIGAGSAMFARVTVELEPLEAEKAVEVWTRLPEEPLIPLELIAAAESAVRDALSSGAALGYPMTGVRATLIAAEFDPAVSNTVSFGMAGADAVRKGMDENIKLLEPWMRLVVDVPGEYGGAILGDISARRGEVKTYEMRSETNVAMIEGIAPLANLFDYIDAMRSLSQGRASVSMEPHEYREAPADVLHRLTHPEEYY